MPCRYAVTRLREAKKNALCRPSTNRYRSIPVSCRYARTSISNKNNAAVQVGSTSASRSSRVTIDDVDAWSQCSGSSQWHHQNISTPHIRITNSTSEEENTNLSITVNKSSPRIIRSSHHRATAAQNNTPVTHSVNVHSGSACHNRGHNVITNNVGIKITTTEGINTKYTTQCRHEQITTPRGRHWMEVGTVLTTRNKNTVHRMA